MSGWQVDKNAATRTPYVDWLSTRTWLFSGGDRFALPRFRAAREDFLEFRAKAAGSPATDELQEVIDQSYGVEVPVPVFAENPKSGLDFTNWIPPDLARRIDPPPEDTVIVGVIDAGIAIGHGRFRRTDGSTRVLASWQQSGVWADGPAGWREGLPFGREVYEAEINDALGRFPNDEEGLYRHLGLINHDHPLGMRELAEDTAHGTHVADLATGFDLAGRPGDVKTADRLRIIAVNLPGRRAISASGSFLDYFVILAIRRIIDLADKLWREGPGKTGVPGAQGYPIVINLSYGLQAGPKDETSLFNRMFERMKKARENGNLSPVRIVLPAGNDNLLRGNIRVNASELQCVPWRVLPEDQTSNFVEIWSDLIDGPVPAAGADVPLAISLTRPGDLPAAVTNGKRDHYLNFGDAGVPWGRIYCRVAPNAGNNGYRIQYVVCLAPTQSYEAGETTVPAGLWSIQLDPGNAYKVGGKDAPQIYVNVQSDQTIGPGEGIGLTSYFDDKHYRTHGEDGAPKDTYRYPFRDPATDNLEPAKFEGPVQRKGTLNAIAGFDGGLVIAGYRASDGAPAPYSATSRGERHTGGRAEPTAAFPSDDGVALAGLLAAGSRSSSAVVAQGTSFATALATRHVSLAFFDWFKSRAAKTPIGDEGWMRPIAGAAEKPPMPNPHMIPSWKLGAGRMPAPDTGRVPRR